jgi:predicted RNA-binding Zn-ribbon protein involved in translation (DUF1610 family)
MLTHLKDRPYYEDLYDHATVEQCRSGESIVNDAFRKMEETALASEFKERPVAWYVEYSKLYLQFVELTAAHRQYHRDKVITAWMERDEQKDRRLASARLSKTPFCRSCGQNLEVMDKYYLHREGKDRNDEDIIFIVSCKPCGKRQTFWEDGAEWEGVKFYCDKCQAEMTVAHKETSDALISTYTCTNCKHSYKETLDLSKRPAEEESVDPLYELDRKRFCIDDDTMRELEDKLEHMARLAKLYADATERTEHADVYDAVKDIKQLKIAQLIETLRQVLEKAQYVEFKLGEPQLGQEVVIEFSCLDTKGERQENDSKNSLRKSITKTLEETNWRLMSEGVHYRLGYLTGRLKAYEGEEALKKLIEQRIKKGTLKPESQEIPPSKPHDPEKLDKVEAIKIYSEGERLTIHTTPVDNGTKRPDRRLTLTGKLHPRLRLVILLRDNDDSVPEFVRSFDFRVESSSVYKKGTGSRAKLTSMSPEDKQIN